MSMITEGNGNGLKNKINSFHVQYRQVTASAAISEPTLAETWRAHPVKHLLVCPVLPLTPQRALSLSITHH